LTADRRPAKPRRKISHPTTAESVECDAELFRLDAGPMVQSVYTPADLEARGIEPTRDIGLPGEYPFTRGISPLTPQSHPPLIKFYTGHGSPEVTNRRYRRLVDWGVEQIQMATDLPSQIGFDPDHVMASGEVGRAGVSIASLADMEAAFDGLPLSRLRRVGMLFNCNGPVGLGLLVALGEKQGLGVEDYVVDIQNDPLKEYVARGTQFLPARAALRLACDVVEWCAKNAPHWYPLDVCVNHFNAAGAGSTYGTAFALANARAYIEELLARGLHIDEFAPSLQMFLDERDDFFAAVANIRATRRIWAEIMSQRYQARDPRSLALQVTAYGHGREGRREPLNNIARIAFGSLAYYLGGVQTLYDASFDEVLSIPSDDAARIAVRIQQIIREEHGFGLTVDPLGGSYYVESLTTDLERGIRAALTEVEDMGGALAAIENGHMRRVISEGAVRRQKRYEAGLRPMVGLDRYQDDVPGELRIPLNRIDPAVEDMQRQRVQKVRARRDGRQTAATLDAVAKATAAGANVVPAVIDAVRAYATVGEICDIFREAFGEWEPDREF
jgi:methylmalonyl-CoA mutase, N-terminal domain